MKLRRRGARDRKSPKGALAVCTLFGRKADWAISLCQRITLILRPLCQAFVTPNLARWRVSLLLQYAHRGRARTNAASIPTDLHSLESFSFPTSRTHSV